MQLELLGQLDPDPLGVQQVAEHHLLLEIRAGRIAEGVPRPPVALLGDKGLHVGVVVEPEAELLANAGMPVLGECLGELH